MGGGAWTTQDFVSYSHRTFKAVNRDGTLLSSYKAQDLFKSRHIQPELNPYKVIRQCCDTDEHPNTIPVILALDVTGSMGSAAAEVAKKLNEVMTNLYDKVSDVEFLIMGIGDLAYDDAPIQASQFESDVRIAEQLDKIYFEGGGGGNGFESYTAAWYFGLKHADLDCWKRGKKGIIITMGDEPLNPYLPVHELSKTLGDNLQASVETKDLYEAVSSKYEVYHLAVNDRETSYAFYKDRIEATFGKYLDSDHLFTVSLDNISASIVNIVSDVEDKASNESQPEGIYW